MTRIIDIHTHVFPPELAPIAIGSLQVPGRATNFYDGTVDGLTAAMDAAHVSVAVTIPVATKPSQVQSINDFAATTESDRIMPFASMHPDFPSPAEELKRIADMGMLGFKMHPEYQNCAPDDERMRPILDAANELGLIAFFHAGADVGPQTLLGNPHAFARMLDLHPGLQVVLAHLGGFRCWADASEVLVGRDVWLDTAYTMGHLPDDDFVSMVREHGADRVLFGSDGPWTDVRAEIAKLRELPFTDAELEMMLGDNAARLLMI